MALTATVKLASVLLGACNPGSPEPGDPSPPDDGDGRVLEKIDLWTGNKPALRGANIHQVRAFEDGTVFDGSLEVYYTQSDFERLADQGANFVNISHPGLFDERAPYALDTVIQENLDELIEMIGEADMFAVIAFRSGPGRSELTFNRDELYLPDPWFSEEDLDESIWASQEKQDAWVHRWRHTELQRGAGRALPRSRSVGP